ncbi:MAG: TnsA endonuclease N-terminal domain-containing protein [Pseudomonas sp.]|uniref:TnsA endonuclease N-terminal domain-containing protein n=1 Tax=Pseudomonas sp. TaxID=306 RepID=UPI002FC5A8EE
MTVRKVVTRRSCHFRGYFPSLKNGKAVPWESQLEGAFLRLLELSPQVLRYAVQPSRERFVTSGGDTTYYPDVCAILHDGAERWFEVKPAEKLLHRRVKARVEAIAIHFNKTNRVFSVISDEDLLVEPFCENLCELMYYRRSEMLISGSLGHVSLLLKEHGPKTVSELGDLFGQGLAWRLLGLGYIGLDLEKPLLPSSPIYLKGGHRHGNFFD